jgi:hypothetical protein
MGLLINEAFSSPRLAKRARPLRPDGLLRAM